MKVAGEMFAQRLRDIPASELARQCRLEVSFPGGS